MSVGVVDSDEYEVPGRIYLYSASQHATVPWWLYWPLRAEDCQGSTGLRRLHTRYQRVCSYIFNSHDTVGPATGAVLLMNMSCVETYCVPPSWARSMRDTLHALEGLVW